MDNDANSGVLPPGECEVAVIGAGPAGLTAACRLAGEGRKVVVLEAGEGPAGGQPGTVAFEQCRIDPGARPFVSDHPEVRKFWNTLLLERDFPEQPLSARIYSRGRFYAEPLRPAEALRKLAPGDAALVLASWLRKRPGDEAAAGDFESRAVERYGRHLYRRFLQGMVEKVYGVEGSELPASLSHSALQLRDEGDHPPGDAVLKARRFRYPRFGCGMLWKEAARAVERLGGVLVHGAAVTRCVLDPEQRRWSLEYRLTGGRPGCLEAERLFSSMPLPVLAGRLFPPVSDEGLHAARMLRHRNRVTVALCVTGAEVRFHDQWLDLADPEIRAARLIQYHTWSPEMTPGPEMLCYGLEYYGFEGDEISTASETALLERAAAELERLGVAPRSAIHGGRVVRQHRALPLDDAEGVRHSAAVKRELEERYPALHLIGRNATHHGGEADYPIATALQEVAAAANDHRMKPKTETMKTKRIIGMSVLPALLASGLLVGCATSPVGELTTRRVTYEKEPGLTRTREVRRTIAPVRLERERTGFHFPFFRTRGEPLAEPVAERIHYRPAGPRIYSTGACSTAPGYTINMPGRASQWW